MKRLQEFINEQAEVNVNITEAKDSKEITFDFTDLENGEETLKSLEDKEGCTVEDNKLTIKITGDNVDKLDTVQDILQQYSDTIRSSQKRSSDEQYAQKTIKFEKKVGEFNDAIDEISNPKDDKDGKDDKDKNEDE